LRHACLFAAQYGIEQYLEMMLEQNRLPDVGTASMTDCARVLNGARSLEKAAEYAGARNGSTGGAALA
jgi:hypothetical protein